MTLQISGVFLLEFQKYWHGYRSSVWGYKYQAQSHQGSWGGMKAEVYSKWMISTFVCDNLNV